MTPAQTLVTQAQVMVEIERQRKAEAAMHIGWIEDTFSDLLVGLEEALLSQAKPYRQLTVTECGVVLSTPIVPREEWLMELDDDLRAHIIDQVKLPAGIEGYPYHATSLEVDDSDDGYEYDPESFTEPTNPTGE